MYFLSYYEYNENNDISKKVMFLDDEESDIAALESARFLLKQKEAYADVLTDTFTIDNEDGTVFEFRDGKLIK